MVGGGLGGLVAAVRCAEQGVPVVLREAAGRLGGRAGSTGPPFVANHGPHGLYADGVTWRFLHERRITVPTARPPAGGARFRCHGKIRRTPPWALLRAYRGLRRGAPVDADFRSWAARRWGETHAAVLCGVAGVFTYHHDPGELSAAFVAQRFARVFALPPAVRYVGSGWATLVAALEQHARALGVDLAGRVAVVTGGSRGLGAATCRALAANGAKVAVNGRDRSAIDAVVRQLRDRGADAVPAAADCTDPAALALMRDRVERQLGPVEVLAAFVGGGRPPQSTLEITADDWRADLDRNLTSTFLTVQTFLPGMIERRRGAIITMASVAARRPGGVPIAYAAAKAGVIVFSQQVAQEVARHHVRVNCLSPSTVMTERMRGAIPADQQRELAARFPLGRLGTPDDVAQAALFLASDTSSWITGITLDITGGQIMT